FVTLVTYQRNKIFGEIVDAEMQLSVPGKIAWEEWMKTAQLRPNVELFEDEFVVMPNHVHGIIRITDAPDVGVSIDVRAERRSAPTRPGVISGSLGAIVRGYKSAVTYVI